MQGRNRRPANARSVVVVLESPHKAEFAGKGGVACGPLRNPNTRQHFRRRLPDLLTAVVESTGIQLQGRPLVIANALQYQTSLQALKKDFDGAIDRSIRDAVWLKMFTSGGGDELIGRMERYQPALVILAPTREVSSALRDRLRRRRAICLDL